MQYFRTITAESLNTLISKRPGETKLGETLQLAADNWQQALSESDAPCVLLGIPEDIGVRANMGVGGTSGFWPAALKALVNVQHTDHLPGDRILLLGAFDFTALMKDAAAGTDVVRLRELVAQIDEAVWPLISAIAAAGKTAVVIGGGHNNAYPIIKGVSRGLGHPINTINLDAHSDYRIMEGRHSGNGFRYAKAEGWLKRYAVVGLHRNYNGQQVVNDMMADRDISLSFYEDIFLKESLSFSDAISQALKFTEDTATGLELDMDCIEGALSSAVTPGGLTPLQARKFIITCAARRPAYFHLCEGAVQLEDGRQQNMTAKLAAYLVTDFLRASLNMG